MRGSVRLFSVFGISINLHFTFILLIIFFAAGGLTALVVLLGVFCFVTIHELCHSLVARAFGISVREITLLPIGGVASMTGSPEKALHEFLISAAGPAFNIAVILVGYYPLYNLLGADVLHHRLSTSTWPLTVAYIYWVNLMLAGFNLIPAFPMDGGRILRSVLSGWLGRRKATRVAVFLGHLFAVGFACYGIAQGSLILVAISVFIYSSASSEQLQTDYTEALKKHRERDILSRDFNADITDGEIVEDD